MNSLPNETILEILLSLTAMESQTVKLVSKDFYCLVRDLSQRNWTEFYKLAGGSISKNCVVYNLQYKEEYYNPWAIKQNFYQLCDDLFCYNDSYKVIVIRSMEEELLRWDMQKPSKVICCDFTTGNCYFTPRITLYIQSGNKTVIYNYYYESGNIEKSGVVKGKISKNTIHKSSYETIRVKKNKLERIVECNTLILAEEVENACYFNHEIYFMKKGIIYSIIEGMQNVVKY